MTDVSRRSFVAGAMVLPFTTWLERVANERPSQKYVRYDATSAEGRAMLRIYADAVRKMKTQPEGSTTGWTFQWYIHSIPVSKTTEIQRIYGSSPSPARTLAQNSWKTCQAHNAPGVKDYFLPWHRAYMLYFEYMIRSVSGVSRFTLPYWNYTVTGSSHGVIPPEFRDRQSPLYVSNRNPGVNNGVAIDNGLNPSPINLGALTNCLYNRSSAPGNNGFNPDLDNGLHGNVHVLTGDSQNMGTVPWAGRDPVFYTHHCQIDRIWYSWQRAGRATPAMSYKFSFVNPDGSEATVDLSQFLDQNAQPYVYQSYVSVPACPRRPVLMALQEEVLAAQSQRGPIPLGPGPVEVTLAPRQGPQLLGAHIRGLASQRRIKVVLRNLDTDVAPGVLYQVLLQLPRGVSGDAARQYHVGYINFFNAEHDAENRGAHTPLSFEFDVSNLARRLAASKSLEGEVRVTIRPVGNRAPEARARPTIGEIVVVHQ